MPLWTVTFIPVGKALGRLVKSGEDACSWQNEDLAKEFSRNLKVGERFIEARCEDGRIIDQSGLAAWLAT